MKSTADVQAPIEPLTYSIPAARRRISDPPIARSTVYRLISAGKLQAVKVNDRTLITAESIQRLVNGGC